MSAVKSKNTSCEKILGSAMWACKLRYRKHYKIQGRPDFVLVASKIAVFCDGDFWHGNNWRVRGIASLQKELENYSAFWQKKILRNIERDKEVNQALKADGWIVLRFWESQIRKSPLKCVQKIARACLKRTKMIMLFTQGFDLGWYVMPFQGFKRR